MLTRKVFGTFVCWLLKASKALREVSATAARLGCEELMKAGLIAPLLALLLPEKAATPVGIVAACALICFRVKRP